ncbi:tripartite tricarboxylate transporter substrate binding protein [Variovorax sp. J22G21]|uniref:Bug family tripartite tricarboxylate transporter substrate binding protein n=1 Tax=Variovorax fucosicus TaxID=3053517 RepID=UPI0025792322|nr:MULTISPECIES: tripartite tricarboxylate transporter substrate binding protein [unclassified Variovorax]MDM0039937.1 tripartite tricarboxylate transporter substrate binding protein [Variovorax sp. J22R193]MDM0061310.1 tripartite tricarboxylate transporter substrate binding protein [Variovorax sp. J22G21]
MIASRSRRSFTALAAALLAAGPAIAASPLDSWPSKPLRIVVGFPGGSTPDLSARTIAEPLSKALGQPVIVENRVGAGGNIAGEVVAHATDNHTISVMINGNMTIAKLLNSKLGYDPLTDLQPVSLVGTAPLVLAVPAATPGNTPQELLKAARASGSSWSYGTPGVGTVGHLGMELLNAQLKTQSVHVPYPGYPQVINGMIGGQLQWALLPPALVSAQARAGKLKVIGVTSTGRSTLVPEYPSLAELGLPGFQLEIWNAVAAPASMPKPIVAKLSALVSEIVRSPEVRAKLFQQGWQAVGSSSEGLANRIKADTAQLGGVIKARGIKNE